MADTFLIIDGHALIYRAFHAFPKTLMTNTGQLTNAVYGFTRILLKSIQDFDPEYLVVAFDHKEKTFRHEKFKDYKAHRPPMPDELISQIDIIFNVVKSLNIPTFQIAGFEADDLIGTLTLLNEPKGIENLVVTGDKDMFQLVTDLTHVFIPGRGRFSVDKEYTPDAVLKKMKVRVDQIVDLKALMGDASDNIPGVKGVGPKTATNLLNEFDTLEKVYQALEAGTDHPLFKKALITKLTRDKELAFLSQDLATIKRDITVSYDLDSCRVKSYDKQQVVKTFEELNFNTLLKFLPPDTFESNVQDALF
jgi:DNA polymerase-1